MTRYAWPVLILIWAAATALVVFADILPAVRPAVVIGFMLICPGMALIRLLRISDTLHEMVFAIGLSLAIDSALASLMLYAGAWNPDRSVAYLIILSVVGALFQIAALTRRMEPGDENEAVSLA